MLKEIYDQPKCLTRTLESIDLPSLERRIGHRLRMVYLTGSGTSYHACLAVNYVISRIASISSSTIPASEFAAWTGKIKPPRDTCLIAVSQSGESRDVIQAAKSAVRSGMRTFAVTNASKSLLARVTDLQIVAQAGPEKALTATKSFTATLLAAYLLALALTRRDDLVNDLKPVSDMVSKTLTLCDEKCKVLASKFTDREFFFLLGSGSNFATALEGALKLKESCNLFAEGFATREFLHGPMQLVDNRTPIFLLQNQTPDEIPKLAESFRRLGAPTIIVGPNISEVIGDTIEVAGGLEELFLPLIYVIPLQLFAYYSSVARGLNPDSPTKLKKVVR
jgi:glucosamine--fructose-6-phosphate aminotransferase (isomerizing)